MGYHDLTPEAFLTIAVQQTNTAEDAFLFQEWLNKTTEITKRLIEDRKQQADVTCQKHSIETY